MPSTRPRGSRILGNSASQLRSLTNYYHHTSTPGPYLGRVRNTIISKIHVLQIKKKQTVTCRGSPTVEKINYAFTLLLLENAQISPGNKQYRFVSSHVCRCVPSYRIQSWGKNLLDQQLSREVTWPKIYLMDQPNN